MINLNHFNLLQIVLTRLSLIRLKFVLKRIGVDAISRSDAQQLISMVSLCIQFIY